MWDLNRGWVKVHLKFLLKNVIDMLAHWRIIFATSSCPKYVHNMCTYVYEIFKEMHFLVSFIILNVYKLWIKLQHIKQHIVESEFKASGVLLSNQKVKRKKWNAISFFIHSSLLEHVLAINTNCPFGTLHSFVPIH